MGLVFSFLCSAFINTFSTTYQNNVSMVTVTNKKLQNILVVV